MRLSVAACAGHRGAAAHRPRGAGRSGLLAGAAVLAAATAVSGCGAQVPARRLAQQPTASPLSFPTTMNPGGIVPWVNVPAVDPYLAQTPPPPPPAVGPACTARQLRGVLPSWISNAPADGEQADPLIAGSLHGYVELTNISARPCTLRGVPSVTLLSRGVPVRTDYARFGAGRAARVGLPPGGKANFRIDWGAPYCPGERGVLPVTPDRGPFSLHAVLGSVRMTVAVHSTASPACVHEETHPNVTRSSVVTSPVQPGSVVPRPVARPSPLRRLRASAGDYPDRIAPGQRLHFVITLANPTGQPVSLVTPPPPSYAIGAYCARTASRPGYQFAVTYSLNTGPRPGVPAHGLVRFAMVLQIPAIACPVHRLTLTWQSPSPGFGLRGPYTSFAIALSPPGQSPGGRGLLSGRTAAPGALPPLSAASPAAGRGRRAGS